MQTVCINVIGTHNVLTEAIVCGARSVICLSTDKASYPFNVMGISKGQHWHHSKWELFIVVSGHGLIQHTKIGTNQVLNFEVTEKKTQAIHMLARYTHNIINLSNNEYLGTILYYNETLYQIMPDTCFELL